MTFSQDLEALIYFIIQILVIFPYSALTIQRQRQLPAPKAPSDPSTPNASQRKPSIMISDKVYALCTSSESVSAQLAKDPTLAPGDAWKKLYGDGMAGDKESVSTAKANRDEITSEDLKRARACGNWGPTEPSDLFLRMYHDALCTIDRSVSGCMVSPTLMGSYGVIPLTVISVVPDIMRHMSNLIVRAEKEVILATNYWQNSVASKYITNAMRELSKRAGERGARIVFKLEYDRGSAKQVLENHYVVPQKEYLGKAVALPAPEDIPNIDLQVINYHRPMLGTFHCKYMVVDRKYAVLQSNNIQDNDNMEMMIHLEGPIVDSLYDMALISWSKALEPPLPSHSSPAAQGEVRWFGKKSQDDCADNGLRTGHSTTSFRNRVSAYSYEPRAINQQQSNGTNGSLKNNGAATSVGPSTTESVLRPADGKYPDEAIQKDQQPVVNGHSQVGDQQDESGPKNLGAIEILQENARAIATTGDAEHIVKTRKDDKKPTPLERPAERLANTILAMHDNGTAPTNGDSYQHVGKGPDAKAREFLSSGEQEIPQSQIQHPSPPTSLLPEHTADDPHYDIDIAGEVARVQTAVSPKQGETRVEAATRHLNHTTNVDFEGNAPDCEPHEEMTPYIPHAVDQPFPIAMVCREPYGTPNHRSVYNPQNEVWLSALRNAKKNVFIQSPTLNAEPLVPAIVEACERGVDVYCYTCLGYNDTGELLPMQGGTNEMIANQMYTTLSAVGRERLHYFFYIGKDQTQPIVAKKKKRDCHIKVMIVDEHIGIQGNGNQDTQSWFHSQEINVMLDSEAVCRAWIDGLRRNQNTHIYGEVSKEDGIWRDDEGNEAQDVIGVDPGRFSWAKGFVGAIYRVRGTGDF